MEASFLWVRAAGTDDEREIPVSIHFSCAPYYPARTWGRPEDCYPAEGGEVTSIRFTSDEATAEELTELDRLYHAGGSLADEIDEACFAVAADDGPDYY